jgi:hypothetical protein
MQKENFLYHPGCLDLNRRPNRTPWTQCRITRMPPLLHTRSREALQTYVSTQEQGYQRVRVCRLQVRRKPGRGIRLFKNGSGPGLSCPNKIENFGVTSFACRFPPPSGRTNFRAATWQILHTCTYLYQRYSAISNRSKYYLLLLRKNVVMDGLSLGKLTVQKCMDTDQGQSFRLCQLHPMFLIHMY